MRALSVPLSDKEKEWKKEREKKKRSNAALMALALKVSLAWMALQVDETRTHACVHPTLA